MAELPKLIDPVTSVPSVSPAKFVYVIVVLLAAMFANSATTLSHGSNFKLKIDAWISAGQNIDVFVGTDGELDGRQKIHPNERHLYTFDKLPADIQSLRVDLSDQINSEIKLYNLSLEDDLGTKINLLPIQHPDWYLSALERATSESDAIVYRTTNSDPTATYTRRVQSAGAGWREYIGVTFSNLPRLFVSLCILVMVTGLCLSRPWIGAMFAVSIILSCVFAYGASFLGPLVAGGPPAVSSEVGYASLSSVSFSAALRSFQLGAVAALIVGALFGLAVRSDLFASNRESTASTTSWPIVLLFSLVSVSLIPDAVGILRSLGGAIHAADYDSQNLTTWSYMVQRGLVPVRDFWYPYGGRILTVHYWPPDIIIGFLHKVAVIGITMLGVWLAVRPSYLAFFALFLAIGAGVQQDLVAAWERYLVSVSIVLTWSMVLRPVHRSSPFYRRAWPIVWHGIWVSYAFFYEATQVIYAAVPCAVLTVLYCWIWRADRQETRAIVLRTCAWTFLVSCLCGLYIAYLWSNGTLPYFLDYWSSLSSMANYGATPGSIQKWLTEVGTAPNLYVIYVLLACFLGSMIATPTVLFNERASRVGAEARLLPFALALLAVVISAKQVMRPDISLQIGVIPLLGIGIAASQVIKGLRSSRGTSILVCVCVGAFAGVALIREGMLGAKLSQLRSVVLTLPQTARAAFGLREEWRAAISRHFAPETFVIDNMRGNTLKDQILKAVPDFERKTFYVFGDDSFIYILFNRTPPRFISHYNHSILKDQLQSVASLAQEKPDYVLWRPTATVFDGLQNAVRMPVVYDYIVRNYRYLATVGELDVLTLVDHADSQSLPYWNSKLGTTVRLGFIPALSHALPVDDAAREAPVLSVKTHSPAQGRTRAVSLRVGEHLYVIEFSEKDGVTDYEIPLDRMWWYSLSQDLGLPIDIASTSESSVTASILKKRISSRQMY